VEPINVGNGVRFFLYKPGIYMTICSFYICANRQNLNVTFFIVYGDPAPLGPTHSCIAPSVRLLNSVKFY